MDYEIVKLKEIANFNKESIGKNSNYEFINYLDTANITNGAIDTIIRIPIEEAPSRAKRIVHNNDIVYSTVRPNLCHYGILDSTVENMIVSTGFTVISCKDDVNPYYVYNYLTQNGITSQLHSIAENSTSAYPSIKPSDLENIEIKLPKLDIQNKIAKILTDIDKKIELNNEINNNLFELMKKTYVEWFKHFNIPNTSFEFKDSELGQIPIDWNIKHLKDVFFFQEGPGIRNWQYVDEDGTKFINIRCIKDRDLELDTANMISNEEAQGKYKHFMLNEWDVVVSTSGTLGRSQIIRKEHLPLCLNTSVIRFKPTNGFDEYAFMYNYLISDEFLNLLDVMATGSAQRNFGPMHLKKIDLVYPSKDIINKFNNLIFPIIENIQNNKAENMKLTQLRDALLPKLMNDEIDLDNIEI